MQPDRQAEEVAAWLSRAEQDLRAARVGMRADPPLGGDAAFHCQQAVEKALKALLTRHDHAFRKTHDIGELGVAALEHEPSFEALLRESVVLTEYAWRFRYPGELFEPDLEEVTAALDLATRVVGSVAAAVRAGR